MSYNCTAWKIPFGYDWEKHIFIYFTYFTFNGVKVVTFADFMSTVILVPHFSEALDIKSNTIVNASIFTFTSFCLDAI